MPVVLFGALLVGVVVVGYLLLRDDRPAKLRQLKAALGAGASGRTELGFGEGLAAISLHGRLDEVPAVISFVAATPGIEHAAAQLGLHVENPAPGIVDEPLDPTGEGRQARDLRQALAGLGPDVVDLAVRGTKLQARVLLRAGLDAELVLRHARTLARLARLCSRRQVPALGLAVKPRYTWSGGCPTCGERVADHGAEVADCPRCGTLHHPACLAQGCAAVGCADAGA